MTPASWADTIHSAARTFPATTTAAPLGSPVFFPYRQIPRVGFFVSRNFFFPLAPKDRRHSHCSPLGGPIHTERRKRGWWCQSVTSSLFQFPLFPSPAPLTPLLSLLFILSPLGLLQKRSFTTFTSAAILLCAQPPRWPCLALPCLASSCTAPHRTALLTCLAD